VFLSKILRGPFLCADVLLDRLLTAFRFVVQWAYGQKHRYPFPSIDALRYRCAWPSHPSAASVRYTPRGFGPDRTSHRQAKL
jgi:hypothetical protein